MSDDSRLGWLLAMAQQDLPAGVSADLVVGWLAGMLSLHLDIEALSAAEGGLTVFVRSSSSFGWTSTFERQGELRATLLASRAVVGAADTSAPVCPIDPPDASAERIGQNRNQAATVRLGVSAASAAIVEARALVSALVGIALSALEPHGLVAAILLTSGPNTVEHFTTFEPQALAAALDVALEALE